MARKSRKPGISESGKRILQGEKPFAGWNAALYARLSVEDRHKQQQDSIQNQLALLERYVQERTEFLSYTCYVDSGESGTGFDRPEFRRMMGDIRAGKCNCVIVKDLSRFARNHIEAGGYLEQVFPFLGVRFIAVNDGFDSISSSSQEGTPLAVPLKNLINELYARDISRKVTSHFTVKQQQGEFLGAFAPYGYLRSKEDRHRLEPDMQTASIVQEIFQWKASGLGETAIAARLNRAGVLAPGRYRWEQGIVTAERFAKENCWHKSAVQRILKNPVYLGHMVQAKQKTSVFWGNQRQKQPLERWVIVNNTHPAIVDEQTFHLAQKTSAQKVESK